MTALLELEPRSAGGEVVEPEIAFPGVRDDLHEVARCAVSVVCWGDTSHCAATH
jgi:hypothetical protein